MRQINKSMLRRAFYAVALLVLVSNLLIGVSQQANAQAQGLSPEQLKLYRAGIYYYDKGYSECSGDAILDGLLGAPGSIQGVYQSGLKQPYILEQFMIHVLKRLAQIYQKPESDFVTKEHVIGMVAFAIGEGGDIANSSIFNPMNGGMDPASLGITDNGVWGGDGTDGRRGYPSFDVGVELYARQWAKGYQSRLGSVVSKPTSTAENFMSALTYYQKYPGNLYWAGASNPDYKYTFKDPVTGKVTIGQDGYFLHELQLVKMVRKSYSNFAGIQIGTTKLEQRANMYHKELLVFNDAGADTNNSTAVTNNTSSNPDYSGFPSGDPPLKYRTNIPIIWNFLVGKGLTPEQAAGVAGNIWQESRFQVDLDDPPAYGLIQWQGDRRTRLEAYAKNRNSTVSDINIQLNFMWAELTGNGYKSTTYEPLKNAKTVGEAADIFVRNFEQPGNYDTEVPLRTKLGNYVFDAMSGVTAGPTAPVCSGSGGNTTPDPTDGKFVFYSQNSSPWGDLPFPGSGGKPIKNAGCGLTSYSMIAATLKQDKSITPKTFLDELNKANYQLVGERGAKAAEFGESLYGLKAKPISGEQAIRSALNSGALVISGGVNGPYIYDSHIIVLRSINGSDMVTVADPEDSSLGNKSFPLSSFISHGSYFVAVSK